MPKTKLFLAISILMLASLACNTLLPTPISAPTQIIEPVNPQPQVNLPRTEDDVPRVDVNVANAAFVSGAAIIVDVRSQSAYEASHVAGALSIPLNEIELNIANVGLDKEQWIITYCT